MSRTYLAVLLLAFGLGCEPPEGQEDVQPTLSDIQAKVFTPSCAISGCHNVESKKGNLILVEGQAFGQLVGIPARQAGALADNKLRVIEGDPDNSYLIQKIEGPDSGEGLKMPPGTRQISDSAKAALRQWVLDGALDN
jgi:hypothetical protein